MKSKKRWIGLLLGVTMIMTTVSPINVFAEEQSTLQSESGEKQPDLKLWYTKPAVQKPSLGENDDWSKEASPLGNGYIGAMVFGGVSNEWIMVNEHTLWSGGPGADVGYNGGHNNNTPEKNATILAEVQEMLQKEISAFTAENDKLPADQKKNFNPSKEITDKINQLKGDSITTEDGKVKKNNFGAYQQLSDIRIADPASIPVKLKSIKSNSANEEGMGNQKVEKAFDGDLGTKWYSKQGAGKQIFPIVVDTEYESPVTTSRYAIVSGNDSPNRDPKNWILYGSDDGKEYKEIDRRENIEFPERKQTQYFELATPVSYKYFKLEIQELKNGKEDGCQMQEFMINAAENAEEICTDYVRALDLDTATATVDYKVKEVDYHREYFISKPANIMAIRLTAGKENSITKKFYITTPQTASKIENEVKNKSGIITLTGSPTDHKEEERLIFAQQVRIIPEGGEIKKDGDGILVTGANEILVLMSAGTNYQQSMDDSFDYFSDVNPLDEVEKRINAACEKGYDKLKEEHIEDYKSLYDNLKLNLGGTIPDKPTDALLAGYNGRTSNPNTASEDLYLETMYYQFGRYLLISSSREGSLPANLQGIWGHGLTPPWNADYHTNINIQMNYWLAEQTNLAECHEPMISYINSLVPRGTQTAQQVFGTDTRGWTTFHENNIWGNTAPAISGAFFTPTAAAWLCQDIWETYAYNMDQQFLEENYNTMLQSAIFLVDILVVDERDGKLVVSPSFSPEHGPYTLGSTFDQAVVWDLFNNVILASKVLGKDNTAEVKEIKNAFANLSGPQIGENGQFQEWKDETMMDIIGDNGHRHVNHLYGLHPGNQIVAGRSEQEDAYVEAMKVTLNTRGDGGTGWSKAWKINFWARLRDGNHAHTMLQELLKESTYSSLFDAHPPFQIDGNFGATAGMTEMLLQSQGDCIELLPAMPSKWDEGNVTGIRARGDVDVDMKWKRSTLTEATITAGQTSTLKIKGMNLGTSTITNAKGENVEYKKIDANTVEIDAKAGEKYIIQDIMRDSETAQLQTELENLIHTAQVKLDEKTPDDVIYDEEVNNELGEAIKVAKSVLQSEIKDYFIFLDAKTALIKAIEAFDAAYSGEIEIATKSGIYKGEQIVKVNCISKIVDVRYTTDGSEPTADSQKYYNGILLPKGITTVKVASFFGTTQVSDVIVRQYMLTDDKNIAQNKKSITPSEDTKIISGYTEKNAVDGNVKSRMATTSDRVELIIEFKENTELNAMTIDQFTNSSGSDSRIKTYKLEYWNENEYVECVSESGQEADENSVVFPNNPKSEPTEHEYLGTMFDTVTTNKVRLTMSGNGVSIWELGMFGNSENVDKTVLKQAIMDAESIETELYTKSSVEAMQTALEKAREIEADKNTTEDIVTASAETLRTAIENLVLSNKILLKEKVIWAEEVMKSVTYKDYSLQSIQGVNLAINRAKTVIEDENAEQGTIDETLKNLIRAVELLNQSKLDWTEVNQLLEEAENTILKEIEEGVYVETTADVYKKAYNDLIKIKNKAEEEGIEQSAIDTAKEQFKQAKDQLEKKETKPTADKTALEKKVTEIKEFMKGVTEKDYALSSIQMIEKALKKAEEILKQENPSQEEINEALKKLEDAFNALEKKTNNGQEPSNIGDDKKSNEEKVPKTGDMQHPTRLLLINLCIVVMLGGVFMAKKRLHRN